MSAELIYEYWKTKPSYVPNKFDIVGSSEKYEGIDELEDLQLELDDLNAVVFGSAGTFVNKTASTVESGLKEMFAMLTVQQPRKFIPIFTKKPTKKAKVSKAYAKKIRHVQRAMDKINRPRNKQHRKRGGMDAQTIPNVDAIDATLLPPAPKLSEVDDFELGQIFQYQSNELADENDYYGAYDDSSDSGESDDSDETDDSSGSDDSDGSGDSDWFDDPDESDDIIGGGSRSKLKTRHHLSEIAEIEQLRQDYESAKTLDRGFHTRVVPNIHGNDDKKSEVHVGYIKSDFSIANLIDQTD